MTAPPINHPAIVSLGGVTADFGPNWIERDEAGNSAQSGTYVQTAGWLGGGGDDVRDYAADPADASRLLFHLQGNAAISNRDGIRYSLPSGRNEWWWEGRIRWSRTAHGDGDRFHLITIAPSNAQSPIGLGPRRKNNGVEDFVLENLLNQAGSPLEGVSPQPEDNIWWYIRIRFRGASSDGATDGVLQVAVSQDGQTWGAPDGAGGVAGGALWVDIQNHGNHYFTGATPGSWRIGPSINMINTGAGVSIDHWTDHLAFSRQPSQAFDHVQSDILLAAGLWFTDYYPQSAPVYDDPANPGKRKVRLSAFCDVGRFGAHDGVGGFLPVDALFEVADDEAFSNVIASATVSVDHNDFHHARASVGNLPADTKLWARVTYTVEPAGKATTFVSPVKTLRTLSAPGAPASAPYTIVGGGCTNFRQHAFAEALLAAGELPDVFFHLGDINYHDSRVPGSAVPDLRVWQFLYHEHVWSHDWMEVSRGGAFAPTPDDHEYLSAGGKDLTAAQQAYVFPTARQFCYSRYDDEQKAPVPASEGEADKANVGAHAWDTEMLTCVHLETQRFRTNANGVEQYMPDEYVTWANDKMTESDRPFVILFSPRMASKNELKGDKDWDNANARTQILEIIDHWKAVATPGRTLIIVSSDHHIFVVADRWIRSHTIDGASPNKTATLMVDDDDRIGPEICSCPLGFSTAPITFDEGQIGVTDQDTWLHAVRNANGFVVPNNDMDAGFIRLTADEQARTLTLELVGASVDGTQNVRWRRRLSAARRADGRHRHAPVRPGAGQPRDRGHTTPRDPHPARPGSGQRDPWSQALA